jgi:FdhD protein
MAGVSRTVATLSAGGIPGRRDVPEEIAVALTYDGVTQAVMMATPADLKDFGLGFTLTEGIAAPGAVQSVEVDEGPAGIDLRLWLAPGAGAELAARRRSRAGPVGCGLCGIESLQAATAAPPPVPPSGLRLAPGDVAQAMAAMPASQALHGATRAAHAAGFVVPGRGLVALREDVGRHNALDKLAGALWQTGVSPGTGAVVMTSRLSVDLVQKVARLGAPVLIGAAAPTAAAVDLAEACGITLVALARGDRFEVFSHPARVQSAGVADVA